MEKQGRGQRRERNQDGSVREDCGQSRGRGNKGSEDSLVGRTKSVCNKHDRGYRAGKTVFCFFQASSSLLGNSRAGKAELTHTSTDVAEACSATDSADACTNHSTNQKRSRGSDPEKTGKTKSESGGKTAYLRFSARVRSN